MVFRAGQPNRCLHNHSVGRMKSNHSAVFGIKRNFLDQHGYLWTMGKCPHEWQLKILRVHFPVFTRAGKIPHPTRGVPRGRRLLLQLCWAHGTGWERVFRLASAMASQRKRRKCSPYALGLSK